MAGIVDGHWLPSHRADPRALALYNRHYSAQKNSRITNPRRWTSSMTGPSAELMVLLTLDCQAVWAWQTFSVSRLDGQIGTYCFVFRNESPVLSSVLVAEADQLAWNKWPGERHWTYVSAEKTAGRRSKRHGPGHCFIEAGWRVCGQSAGGLTILEILPTQEAPSPVKD